MKQVVPPNSPFRLAGYSFGCCVAFEMALQLRQHHPEQPDILKSLHMLDGSHQYVKYHTEAYRQKITSEDMAEAEALGLYMFMIKFINNREYQKVILGLNLFQTFIESNTQSSLAFKTAVKNPSVPIHLLIFSTRFMWSIHNEWLCT